MKNKNYFFLKFYPIIYIKCFYYLYIGYAPRYVLSYCVV